ncbi:MAG: T9SS type A sorting domain-containing protein [Bacteroidota bacterium]
MKYRLFIIGFLLPSLLNSQELCNNGLLFEEQDGLLIIEAESVEPHSAWVIDTVESGFTGEGYIFWTGAQYFNSIPNRRLNYNIKINTPGTYQFSWRVKVGKGADLSEHNDSWLKIEADDFFGKNGNHIVRPKPQCQNDPNADCPNGSSTGGFFKIYGRTLSFRFAAATSDHDPHAVFARFDRPGQYKITIDARSSFFLMDRLFLKLTSIPDQVAMDTRLSQSPCAVATNTQKWKEESSISIYPNPVSDFLTIRNMPRQEGILQIKNSQGVTLSEIKISHTEQVIDIQNLSRGIYFLMYQNEQFRVSLKFSKI